METIKFLDLSSLFFGLASSTMFSVGGLTMSQKEIAKISQPLFGPNPAVSKSLILQKYQFLLGALLLGMSFLLQLAKVLELQPSSAIVACIHKTYTWHLVLAFLTTLLLSYWLSCAITKWQMRKIEKPLEII